MRVLVIEDSPTKQKAICELIDKSYNHRIHIDMVKEFEEAKRKIRDYYYDLYILDFAIENEEDECPKIEDGIKIYEILKDRSLEKNIIGYSNHSNIEKYHSYILNDISFIKYETTNKDWEKVFIKIFNDIIENNNINLNKISYDIAIITALKDEFEFMKKASNTEWHKNINHKNDLFNFWTTKIINAKNESITIVAYTHKGAMGMSYASAMATKMIGKFSPKYLVMTGICAGSSKKTNKGDVIIADYYFNYQAGDIRDGNFVPILKNESINGTLNTFIDQTLEEYTYEKDIRDDWEKAKFEGSCPNGDFEIRMGGSFGTGSAVIKDKTIIEDLQTEKTKDFIALDMEAYSVMIATEFSDRDKPTIPLVIKAVQDYADAEKDDSYRNFASYASARFFFKFCEDRLLDEIVENRN